MGENHSLIEKERPSLRQIILFSFGQLGYSLASFSAINLLVFFYMPPETGGETIFPQFIYTEAVFGVLTLLGVLNFGSRIFDAITEPLMDAIADKTQTKWGHFRPYLLWLALPFAIIRILALPHLNYPAPIKLFMLLEVFLRYGNPFIMGENG